MILGIDAGRFNNSERDALHGLPDFAYQVHIVSGCLPMLVQHWFQIFFTLSMGSIICYCCLWCLCFSLCFSFFLNLRVPFNLTWSTVIQDSLEWVYVNVLASCHMPDWLFSQSVQEKYIGMFTKQQLHSRGKLSYMLGGDKLQHGLNKNLGFKPEDRTENNCAELVSLFLSKNCLRKWVTWTWSQF